MDKMVEIARFQYPSEAQTLISLLKSEGIDCYLRDEYSSQIMAGYVDIGGARVEILESDVPHALQIMKDCGYEIPDENSGSETVEAISRFGRKVPWLNRFSLEKQILILLALIASLLGLLIFASSQF